MSINLLRNRLRVDEQILEQYIRFKLDPKNNPPVHAKHKITGEQDDSILEVLYDMFVEMGLQDEGTKDIKYDVGQLDLTKLSKISNYIFDVTRPISFPKEIFEVPIIAECKLGGHNDESNISLDIEEIAVPENDEMVLETISKLAEKFKESGIELIETTEVSIQEKKRHGRKPKQKPVSETTTHQETAVKAIIEPIQEPTAEIKKRRGRPPGSKNKSKQEPAE